MKILFSPSETKIAGGDKISFDKNSFIFPQLFEKRMEIVKQYNDFITSASKEELIKLFGTKIEDVLEQYSQDLFKTPTTKVIQRYDGVAFDYLEYSKLKEDEKFYIDENVLIFSNLFGVLKAGDLGLPDYKLKQGETFSNLKIEKIYNDNFSKVLDEYLKDEDILDFSKNTSFNKLEIIDFVDGEVESFVTFKATLFQNKIDISFIEKSRFLKVEGIWKYVDGQFIDEGKE